MEDEYLYRQVQVDVNDPFQEEGDVLSYPYFEFDDDIDKPAINRE
jgi:hypothetical protein